MSTQDDVRRLALSLPEVVEATGQFGFCVPDGDKLRLFAWAWPERVHPKRPRRQNPGVLVVRVDGLNAKALLLDSDPEKFFTDPHYARYPSVLVRLGAIGVDELEALLVDAWSCMAPPALRRSFEH